MDHAPSNLKAALWMLASVAGMTAMAVAGRMTASRLHVLQVMEIRSVLGFVMLLPLVVQAGGLHAMRTQRPLQHIGRNIAHYTGQAAWLYALVLIPLGELISIEFTTPIWTALLATAFLGERLGKARIAAILLGLAGIVIIVRPDADGLDLGHLVVLGAAFVFGISLTMTKALTRTEPSTRIIFWMLIIQSAIGLVPAVLVWQTPVPDLWPWLLLIAFTGTASHYFMARALSHADATFIAPIDFLRVPAAAVVGWLLYAERIDAFTAAGAALILTGNLLNLRRSAKAAEGGAP